LGLKPEAIALPTFPFPIIATFMFLASKRSVFYPCCMFKRTCDSYCAAREMETEKHMRFYQKAHIARKR
jgi:hypothetical protein